MIQQSVTLGTHPLEPLNREEIVSAIRILKEGQALTAADRFVSVMLKEPGKEVVQRFDGTKSFEREAAIIVLNNERNAAYEAVVSIGSAQVVSWKHVPGVQPSIMLDEQIGCEAAVKSSSLFTDALERLGIPDSGLVMVDLWSAGNWGTEEDASLRLARPLCFLRSDDKDNGYARPLPLVPIVDLNAMQVLRVEEYEYAKIPSQPANYTPDRVGPLRTGIKPIEIIQPEGPSFSIDGHEIEWQNWKFRIGFNAREGLTLHTVSYRDQGRERPVLYRAALSEMVVPYGDPGAIQNRKNAFDSGEYGIGQLANSLELGCDCVGYIKYFDGVMSDSKGELFVIPNAICMHEEDYGILWKHTDWRTNDVEVRRSRRLVVSSISTVANYEYGFFWYLYQDGNIQFEVKLTGILSTAGLHPGETPKYGTMIGPDLYAPNHQHFFNVRMDMMIDGNENSVYEVNVVPEELGEGNPRENAFYAQSTLLTTESEAVRDIKLETARYWKFVNDNVKNDLGQSVGYKIMTGENCFPFASDSSSLIKRAGFIKHHLWVTPYNENEMYASGKYPNQNIGGDGLSAWVEQDRPVVNKDIVVWYTMGHTHVPRPEDWPVMPAAYIGFTLKPVGFFNQSPAIDLPPSPKKNYCSSSVKASGCQS
ncbi:tyramine oxidase [Paenibacillus darwinianus]|uniref:Amine oxidase n=1 Tax=Paenibacillus darwinianus TaxID=1380763 RepID=A0A9W5W879_9BACL|nr:primary-amine oxidase [Paenibacillus darwinianus]EXX90377.1 tyramine oxidase [Paenibacillus darwinianus]EXX91103.1 tyramine oxidase [Paenibacillus darwinianus]EXX91955.1 tyramine oxidase [Paenibacillus darwinianus]